MSTEKVSNEEKGNGVLADVMAMLTDLKKEIDDASEYFMDSFQPLENNECSWQVVDESFKAGVEWLIKRLKGN